MITKEEIWSAVMDVEVEEEYALAQRRCYESLCSLMECGIFNDNFGVRECEQLRMAYSVIAELEEVKDSLLTKDYPHPGDAFTSLELHGLFRCYYRYNYGVEYINYFRFINFHTVPVMRLYINEKLVGLFIFGQCVMDFYREYIKWLCYSGYKLPIMEVLL